MSIWRSGSTNVDEDQSEVVRDFPTKAYTKIDTTSKLQVIQALDNGQCKADIAREYGVHPQTIAYIYKQKESIINKYTQKYNLLKQVCQLNLEQNLLDWFDQQYQNGNVITEDQLHKKALEILKPLNEEFTCIDDWLFNFQMRHNISKYIPRGEINEKPKEEWKRFLDSSDTKDIYLGSVTALSYNLDFNGYLNGQNPSDGYVSIMFIVNTIGTDKKPIAVAGSDSLESEPNVKSLPLDYYYCANSQVNQSMVVNYLNKWDSELAQKGKSITLVLNVPENMIRNLQFGNIRVINAADLDYATIVLEKLVQCLKYYYRRLQISRNITYGKDNSTYLDYIHMIGNAWHNVPQKYIQTLCLPPGEGSLYFNIPDLSENNYSLSHWCKANTVPLNTDQCPSFLDKYVVCDNELPYLYCGQSDENSQSVEVLSQKTGQSSSGIEAYQAMKRLVSYLQGESASGSVMKYAKYLENHAEYGALLQMHQIIGSTNNSM